MLSIIEDRGHKSVFFFIRMGDIVISVRILAVVLHGSLACYDCLILVLQDSMTLHKRHIILWTQITSASDSKI